jgi:hypothetical protein
MAMRPYNHDGESGDRHSYPRQSTESRTRHLRGTALYPDSSLGHFSLLNSLIPPHLGIQTAHLVS